jgi:hypothetical protein
MLEQAEATDAREDRQFGPEASGPAMPKDLKRRGDRLARLKACQEKLESRAAAAAARQQEKIAAREAEDKATGQRQRGRQPKDPDPRVDPDTVANPTDPDSGIIQRHHKDAARSRRGAIKTRRDQDAARSRRGAIKTRRDQDAARLGAGRQCASGSHARPDHPGRRRHDRGE